MPPQQSNSRGASASVGRLTWALSASLFGIGAVLGRETFSSGTGASPWWYAVFAVAMVAALWEYFPVRLGRRTLGVHFDEVPAAFALAYLAPLPAGLVVAASAIVARRFADRAGSHKLAFNAGIAFLRYTIAAVIFAQAPDSPLRFLWLAAALVLASVVADSITLPFVGFATGQRPRLEQMRELLAVAAVASSVAVVSTMAVQAHLSLAILPAGVGALLWALVRQQNVDRQIYRDLTQAHRFSIDIATVDPRSVLSVGLASIAEIMDSNWVAANVDGTPHVFGERKPNDQTLCVDLPGGNTLEVGSSSGFTATAPEQFQAIGHLFDNARRRAELTAQIEHSALHDRLTGLLSQEGLVRATDASLSADGAGTLMMFDLSRFAQVNDTLGFAAGDRLLEQIGARLGEVSTQAGGPALAARLGGDSFGVFVTGCDRKEALNLAAAIRTALTEPIAVAGVAITVGARVGIAYAPKHGETAGELVRACGVAARQARTLEPPVVVYRADTDVHTEARLEMVYHLQAAVASRNLDVHYQPKVDAISRRVIGAEALIRWRQEDGSFIPPADFIPAAEAAGMMSQVTDFVLDRALADLKTWPTAKGHLGVAVNLSPTTLLNPETPGNIAGLLARHNVEPGRLTIEITESVMVSDTKAVASVLDSLRGIGVRLSIDDFGTGYSSLSYLKDLEIDELKLDRAFVADLAISDRSVTIARTVTALGHSLGLQVVAEGVETPEAAALLREMNVDVVQGFFVARPMPSERFIRWHRMHPTYDLGSLPSNSH